MRVRGRAVVGRGAGGASGAEDDASSKPRVVRLTLINRNKQWSAKVVLSSQAAFAIACRYRKSVQVELL